MAHKSDSAHKTTYAVQIGQRGRIVLPAEVRDRLGVKPGDRLILFLNESGGLRVKTARQVADEFCGIFADLAPGRSLSEELIRERREEAAREDAE